MKQLKAGIKVESEHKDMYNFMKKYVAKHKTLPPQRVVFMRIAKAHIKEDPQYYSKLKKCRL